MDGEINTVLQSEFIDFATSLADTARPIAMRYFKDGVGSEQKSDNSPVTIADQEIERILRSMIEERYPEHGILGEEFGTKNLDADYVWVMDPIDGTHCFTTGYPMFGCLIALLKGGKPILGIIDAPALNNQVNYGNQGNRWIGAQGQPTTLNGQAVTTRSCATLKEAWITASSPFMFEEGSERDRYNRLQHTSTQRPVFSGNCVAYGLLASGKLDIVVEADLGIYDFMAVIPIIEGAGGIITDWDGLDLTMQSSGVVLAAGDRSLHTEALKLLQDT